MSLLEAESQSPDHCILQTKTNDWFLSRKKWEKRQHIMTEMLLREWTCEAAAGQRPDEDGDESHAGCAFCCVDWQMWVLQCWTHTTINLVSWLEDQLTMQSLLSMEMICLLSTHWRQPGTQHQEKYCLDLNHLWSEWNTTKYLQYKHN